MKNLIKAYDTLKKSLKPMIDQHMETSNMAQIQQAALVSNLEKRGKDLNGLVKTVEKLNQMNNVLLSLVCGLAAVTLVFFAVFIYTRCSNRRQFH